MRNPDIYRVISIVSSFGKLFTSVLNQRLGIFIDGYGLIGSERGGFRKGHSTIDHVFVLKTLIDLYLNEPKRINCCSIDYQKTFENVCRVGLWTNNVIFECKWPNTKCSKKPVLKCQMVCKNGR